MACNQFTRMLLFSVKKFEEAKGGFPVAKETLGIDRYFMFCLDSSDHHVPFRWSIGRAIHGRRRRLCQF